MFAPISPPSKLKTYPNKSFGLILIAIVAIIVVISRLQFINTYSIALPFWDQWDSEGNGLLRPWLEGDFTLAHLWAPHNEHRVFPSRLLTLLTFTLTGSWNNLTEAKVNIIFATLIPVILIWFLYRQGVLKKWNYLLIFAILGFSTLPFSWENTLFGFQSQFYFLILFAVCAIILTVFRPYNLYAIPGILFLSALSVLTMASGLFTPFACLLLYGTHAYLLPGSARKGIIPVSILLVLVILAFVTMPSNSAHDQLHAQNITELFLAVIKHLTWPFKIPKIIGAFLWLYIAFVLFTLLKRKTVTQTDLVMMGFYLWTGMQAMAMSYARGHEEGGVLSRYSDLLTLGWIANCWFMLRSLELFHLERKWKYALNLFVVAFFVFFFIGLRRNSRSSMNEIRTVYQRRVDGAQNVYNYLKTGDKTYLYGTMIPYPHADKLQGYLDNQTLRNIIPKLEEPVKK